MNREYASNTNESTARRQAKQDDGKLLEEEPRPKGTDQSTDTGRALLTEHPILEALDGLYQARPHEHRGRDIGTITTAIRRSSSATPPSHEYKDGDVPADHEDLAVDK